MADLEDTLNSILSDPEAMGQIMALAGSLGLGSLPGLGGPPDPSAPPEPPEATEPPLRPPPGPDLEALGQMAPLLSALQGSGGTNREAAALIAALRPFLSQERQRKVDRALKAADMSRTATQVLRLWKEGELGV